MAATPEHANAPAATMGTISISEARKQMLVDNLQLEITERARKLRAQYAMQAQGLRTRLEMRVNRIPHALRHANMQDLVNKYSQPQPVKTAPAPPSPQKISYPALSATTGNARGIKRNSDAMPQYDKENEQPAGNLENPKKRVKTTTGISAVASKPSRTVSRKAGPNAVLSPKSHNSRTFPTSPIKPSSPVKESVLPKPTSRIGGTTAAKQTRPASRQTKRPAATAAQPSAPTIPESSGYTAHNRPSSGSDDSNGTTIMKKPVSRATGTTTAAAAKKAATATTKVSRTAGIKNALSSLTGSKRAAASKKGPAVAPMATTTHASSTTTVGGRTLRKRGSFGPPVPPKTSTTVVKAAPAVSTTDTASIPGTRPTTMIKVSPSFTAPTTTSTSKITALPSLPPIPSSPSKTSPSRIPSKTAASTRKAPSTRTGNRVSSGRIEKAPRRSSGVKRFGSRRIGKLVEKGKGLFTRSKAKAK